MKTRKKSSSKKSHTFFSVRSFLVALLQLMTNTARWEILNWNVHLYLNGVLMPVCSLANVINRYRLPTETTIRQVFKNSHYIKQWSYSFSIFTIFCLLSHSTLLPWHGQDSLVAFLSQEPPNTDGLMGMCHTKLLTKMHFHSNLVTIQPVQVNMDGNSYLQSTAP